MKGYIRIFLHTMIVIGLGSLLAVSNVEAAGKVKELAFFKYENTLTVKKGETLKLKVKITPKSAKNKKLEWSSNNPKVVSVTHQGVIKAKKKGKATILAKTTDGSKKKLKLKVIVGTKVSAVAFENSEDITELEVGKNYQFKVTVSPEKASNKKVKWSSSDEKIATVDAKGMVTGKANGVVRITAEATDGSGKKASIKIQVISLVKSVSLSLKSKTAYCTALNTYGAFVKKGQIFSLNASFKPENATNQNLVWSTSNPSVAQVVRDGEIFTIGCGVATITAQTVDGSGEKDTFTVYVSRLQKDDCKFIAHRGQSELAPDNSQTAVRLAFENGFDYVEIDIWKTLDNGFVVSHDESLKTSCGVDVKITELTTAQAMSYRITEGKNVGIYSNEYIPSLEQILTLTNAYPGKTLCIELKQVLSKEMLEKLLEIIRQYGLEERVKLITFHKQNIETIRTLSDLGGDTIPLEYLCNTPDDAAIQTCIDYHTSLGSKYNGLTEYQVEWLHQKGLEVNVWNIPNFITAYHMIHTMHIDAVTSDYQFFE